MRQRRKTAIDMEVATGMGDFAAEMDAANDEFNDLANAVASLTEVDIFNLTCSLNAADAWDVEDATAANDGVFLAN